MQRKPVVIALLGSTLVEEARTYFERAHIPAYPFPERAASALGALGRRVELLDNRTWTADRTVLRLPSTASPEALLQQYSIPTALTRLARSIEEASGIAVEIGYPIVIKIASPDILHKSDVGGVVLNIDDLHSLRNAFTQMMKHVQEAEPEARIEGIHLQRQAPPGQEVIVGALRDPQFGPLLMFGSGGVEVEGLRDVAFALAPLTRAEAMRMIRRTWAGRKLAGFRNIPAVDEQAVIDVLVKLSNLVMDHEFIEEIEINPLRVFSNNAIALDVRMK
jgi:acetyltransferase